MPKGQNDVSSLRLGDTRVFIQEDGISPANSYNYFGCTSLGDAEQSEGEPTPIYCPSPSQHNVWDIIDQIPSQQELGTVDFSHRASRDLTDTWWKLRGKRCNFNMQVTIGRCTRPDDFNDWEAKLLFRNSYLSSFTAPTSNPLSGEDNDGAQLTGSLTFWEIIPIRPLIFGEVADSVVLAEVLDGFYYDTVNCGDCGQQSDGCQKAYWLTKANAGSPGLSSQIVVTINGHSTYRTIDIAPLAGSSGVRAAAVGRYLVVLRNSGTNSHLYERLSQIDAGTSNFTVVTSGYVALKGPTAIYSRNSSQTFLAGKGGYIYLMTDPTRAVTVLTDGSLSVQDLADIHGFGSTIVAVGGSNAILASNNGGRTFATVTGPSVGIALTAVWVLSKTLWLVGNASGDLYFTIDGGSNWTEISLEADVTNIRRIYFHDDVVGYLSADTAAGGRVYRTTNGGNSWEYAAPSLDKLPSNTRINALTTCDWNEVAVGGLNAGDTDGMIAVAS